MSEEQSRLQVAVTTPVGELTDEQKTLISESWAALDEAQMETYASLKPEGTPSPAPAGDTTPPAAE